MTALPPLVSEMVQRIQHALSTRCMVRQVEEGSFLLQPEQQPLAIAFYLLHPNRRHMDDAVAGQGRRVIHVDEDQWRTAGELIIGRLVSLCGKGRKIHARTTVAARIHVRTALAFQQEHHLQVALPGKYRYGLFANGELVSVAVFSGGRRMRDQPASYRSFELLRFCHKQGCQVVGGFTKLLKAFIRDFQPGDIMTYADKDWSDGSAYMRTGFKSVDYLPPQSFWIHDGTFHRYSETRLPEDIRQLSPEERAARGYVPLKNSGSLKMVLSFTRPHPISEHGTGSGR